MALTKTISLIDNFGESVEFKDAYIKVLRVVSSKDAGEIIYGVSRASGEEPVQTSGVSFVPDLAGPNPIKQAYLHLKTLPELADAIDC
jgi:hypothetical protein